MKGVFPFVRAAFLLEKALSYVEKALFIAGLLTENVPADRRGLWAGKAEQGIEKGKKAGALRY